MVKFQNSKNCNISKITKKENKANSKKFETIKTLSRKETTLIDQDISKSDYYAQNLSIGDTLTYYLLNCQECLDKKEHKHNKLGEIIKVLKNQYLIKIYVKPGELSKDSFLINKDSVWGYIINDLPNLQLQYTYDNDRKWFISMLDMYLRHNSDIIDPKFIKIAKDLVTRTDLLQRRSLAKVITRDSKLGGLTNESY